MKRRLLSLLLALACCPALSIPCAAERDQPGTLRCETVITPQYEEAEPFSEGLAAVKKDGKWGYIDTTGKYVIKPKYEEASDFFDNGLACIQINGKWGFIDKTGEFVTPPQFSGVNGFSFNKGYISVSKGAKIGIMDDSGKIIIEPIYNRIEW